MNHNSSEHIKHTQSLDGRSNFSTKEQIEIFVSCQNLRVKTLLHKHFPSIALYIQKEGVYELKGQTEKQRRNITNPSFMHSFVVDYIPTVEQNLKFVVLATDKIGLESTLGVIHTTLSGLLEKNEQTAIFDIIKSVNSSKEFQGKLALQTEHVAPTHNYVKMVMQAYDLVPQKKFFGKVSWNLSFQLLRSIGDHGGYVPIFESKLHQTEAIEWQDIEIGLQKLCNRDSNKPIKLQLLNYASKSKYSIIGETVFTVNDLIEKKGAGYNSDLINPSTGNPCGMLTLCNFELIQKPLFLDYINAGVQFNLLLGIDFTISNGNPHTHESLHSLKLEGPNEYEKAIKGIFGSLLKYSSAKRVRMFGFGGIDTSSESHGELMSHCFPLTNNDGELHAVGLDSVLKVYRDSVEKVQFGSPSYLEPLISQGRKVAKYVQNTESDEYVVLVILTDGKCHDMEDTINTIVQSSKFPLSVVIVGLGGNNFSKMEILSGNHGLVNKKGNPSQRNIVQFLQARKIQNSSTMLGRQVMERLSEQMLEYMFNSKTLPQHIQHRKELKVEESSDSFSATLDIGEDSCEEDKNKNISSFIKNEVMSKTMFFRTTESPTKLHDDDNSGIFSDEDLCDQDKNRSISSFNKSQVRLNPSFLKLLSSRKDIETNEPYSETLRSEEQALGFFKYSIAVKTSEQAQKENPELKFLRSSSPKPTILGSTMGSMIATTANASLKGENDLTVGKKENMDLNYLHLPSYKPSILVTSYVSDMNVN